jgi:hypothetical protein
LRLSGSFIIFLTKNYYLGGKNSARFIPQQGKAAKRYQQPMRNLKNLNISQSIKFEKLIFDEKWFDKIDRLVIYFFFTWGAILPFLIFNDPYQKVSEKTISSYLIFIITLVCLYVIYRKATEKNLIKITSKYNLEKNIELVNEYCRNLGYEKYRNSKNIIIYNEENIFNVNPNYQTSRVFLLSDKYVYFTIVKENYKLNIPTLTSHLFLKKDLNKILNK